MNMHVRFWPPDPGAATTVLPPRPAVRLLAGNDQLVSTTVAVEAAGACDGACGSLAARVSLQAAVDDERGEPRGPREGEERAWSEPRSSLHFFLPSAYDSRFKLICVPHCVSAHATSLMLMYTSKFYA